MSKEKTQFKAKGLGTKNKQQPISVMFAIKVDEILRSLPNRSEYIRNAVLRQLKEDGLID